MIPDTAPPLPPRPFSRFAQRIANTAGRPAAFVVAVAGLVVWAVFGPVFRFSDTWQLLINTMTTIITFLMVFLIQNTQNRDSLSIHIKLDELIRTHRAARNALMMLEQLDDDDLQRMRNQLEGVARDGPAAEIPTARHPRRRRGARRRPRPGRTG